jgi:hypothetical protein
MSNSPLTRISLLLDDWRVRQHFKRVERVLRARDVSHLPNALQAARARHLDDLHRYATRGVFPRNHERAGYAPCFIDGDARECAVAHLVMSDGLIATAHKIADFTNYASVPEMRFPELDTWAAQSGFSKDELALIQPSYVYDPELRQMMPQLAIFAYSMMSMSWMVLLATVAAIFTSSVNIVKMRHRKMGNFWSIIGLMVGVYSLGLAVSITNQIVSAAELIAQFDSYQPPMIDWEISIARSTYYDGWASVASIILVGALCLALSVARLRANRRLMGEA